MNLFTLTDHDSIEGAEQLRRNPNFFVSEELTCKMPSGTEIHIGVYDFTERQHLSCSSAATISSRSSCISPNAASSSASITFSPASPAAASARISHGSRNIFRPWRRATATCWKAPISAPRSSPNSGTKSPSAAATRTPCLPPARPTPKFPAPATRKNFSRDFAPAWAACRRIRQLRKLTRDVFVIAYEMMREKSWTTLLSPLAALIPVITYWNYHDERAFVRRWSARNSRHA